MPMWRPKGSVNKSALICTSQLAKHKKMQRDTNAPAKPAILPMCCLSAGSLSDVMVMKTKLSTPKTISKNKSVSKLIHASGVVKIEISKCKFLFYLRRALFFLAAQ